jgi:hypothetical protein
MKCPPKMCKPVKEVREEDRAIYKNGSTKILATLPPTRREGSKGAGRRTKKNKENYRSTNLRFLNGVTETCS